MRIAQFAFGLATIAAAQAASAQPADLPIVPATTDSYPSGFKVIRTKAGPVYANADGQTLYGLDMRTLIRFGPNPAVYCKEDCQKNWQPMLADAGAKPNIAFPRGFGSPPSAAGQRPPTPPNPNATIGPDGMFNPQRAPDWTVIAGANGPQWVYKGWHLVFVRKGEKAGSTAFDGADSLTWNTLKFVPPVPKIAAPQFISAAWNKDGYVLTDKSGRALFTGACRKDCGSWVPLGAPAAGRGMGEWSVSRAGDTPQWLYRGKPVFVGSTLDASSPVPASGKVLRP